jgi:phage/plasmid primase-like uncharacterized protein/replicative DNA helicase
MIDVADIERRFLEAMARRGILPPRELRGDGEYHRTDVDGKHGKNDASYKLYMDGIPAGGFQNHRDGLGWESWCSRDKNTMSDAERVENDARIAALKKDRAERDEKEHAQAAEQARRIWDTAQPVFDHPYLSRKGVQSYGLRVAEDGRLVVPLRDGQGAIHTVEFIPPGDGESKMFLKGGAKCGHWFSIGGPNGVICVAEGYATAASIHGATGHAVAVAFDCDNLIPVAEALRAKYPEVKLVICADDDHERKGNPGITCAQRAAKLVSGMVAIPAFGPERPPKATDFNDLETLAGVGAVASCIEAALAQDDGPIEMAELSPRMMEETLRRKSGKTEHTLRFGIEEVDKMVRLRRGWLTVIAGLPGMGKTAAVAGVLAYNAARGVPCLLFSLEMVRYDIWARFAAIESRISAVDITDEELPVERMDWKRVVTANGELERMRLTIDDRELSIAKIADESQRWFQKAVVAKGGEMGLIAIDYLGLIHSEERTENRNREVAALVQRVKLLAKSLRIPVMLLAQLNRKAAARGGEPEMSDCRDSGEIEATADVILFPYPSPRDENGMKLPMPGGGDAVDKWIIAKHRSGRKGAVIVNWNPYCMHFTGIDDHSESPAHWQDER